MKIEKVIRSKNKKQIKELYLSSFPKEERMPFIMMLLMSCLWNTEFLAFYDEDKLCGIIYLAALRKQTFIMFFAVDEKLRSQGYGSRILNEVEKLYPKNPIIVSIEPCFEDADNIEQKLRRKSFYQRNDYVETGYFMKLAGQVQEILIKNGMFDKRQFRIFFVLYSCGVMMPKVWKKESKIV